MAVLDPEADVGYAGRGLRGGGRLSGLAGREGPDDVTDDKGDPKGEYVDSGIWVSSGKSIGTGSNG
jgi:hypothetical protein